MANPGRGVCQAEKQSNLPDSPGGGTIAGKFDQWLGENMQRSGSWWFVVACLALSQSAAAQVIWDMPNVIKEKPAFDHSTIKPGTDIWPRLDPGAVFCKTEADLVRLAASRRGEPGDRPNCQLIQSPTPIQIEKRVGPGRTQVALTNKNGQDGWTDAWLPERTPPIGGKGMTIK
jgi:hypothetical protein